MSSQNTNQSEFVDSILVSIRKIILRVSSHSKQMSKHSGLTLPQFLCLKAVAKGSAEEQAFTIAEVAREVNLSPATVTGIVDRMERAELIRRERQLKDRRKISLVLTETGKEKLENLPSPLQDIFIQRLSHLDKAEREEIQKVLERVVTLMDAEELDASPLLDSDAVS